MIPQNLGNVLGYMKYNETIAAEHLCLEQVREDHAVASDALW